MTTEANTERSIRTTVESAEGWHLMHRTAGIAAAGSGRGMVDEAWGVITQVGGTMHGKWFVANDVAGARAHFADRVAAVIADREEIAKHRPATLRAQIETDVERLTTLRKYGKFGKRGKLVGADAKRERAMQDRIAENQQELSSIQAAAVATADAVDSDDAE